MMANKCWVAYQSDFSEIAVFESEIECLRYAIDNGMLREEVPYGHGIRNYIHNHGKKKENG